MIRSIAKLKKFIFHKLQNELPTQMYYHHIWHTQDVLDVCNKYIQRLKLNHQDAFLLRTAAIVHDVGLIWGHHDHEQHAIEYATNLLPNWKYTNDEIKIIIRLIEVTKLPQRPSSSLEKIFCDADLDYLGTDKFFKKSNLLRDELIHFKIIKDHAHWHNFQLNFLESHEYHTDFAMKNRNPIKQKNIQILISKN
jgi:uncharacterized protein